MTANVVGNPITADSTLGFRQDVEHAFESYAAMNCDLANDFQQIITNPTKREEFKSMMVSSMLDGTLTEASECVNDPYYRNFAERFEQLMDNSFDAIAKESVTMGYAPIVSYNPFFLKKMWVSCVYTDVLMAEVPKSPVINYAFEKNYLRDQAGNLYPLPEVNYDNDTMKALLNASQGLPIKEDAIAISSFKPYLNLLQTTYVPGVVPGDLNYELTQNLHVWKVIMRISGVDYEVLCDYNVDVTTHNWVGDPVTVTVGGVVHAAQLSGHVDFDKGFVTILTNNDEVTHVCLRGRLANRYNNRSLDVVRKVTPIQFTMPESGPRLNAGITVEDAADAMALQKIDIIAYNVDLMGRQLADFQDFEIRTYLKDSHDAMKAADALGADIHGYTELAPEGEFNVLPYDTYARNITEWMKDSREWVERLIARLKVVLKAEDMVIVMVAHPNTIRYIQDGINWVFTNDTQISGIKLNYRFGIFTTASDRVHVITTMYLPEEEGIDFYILPLRQDMITYKHFFYNMIIDRNYRNPVHTLVPNIMTTQRTLTVSIIPLSGKMNIVGREMHSPDTLKRAGATVLTITITTEPAASTTVSVNDPVSLAVAAVINGTGTLSYQWYEAVSADSTIGASVVAGETNATFSAPTTAAGTKYYFCRVSVTGATAVDSTIATVTVE